MNFKSNLIFGLGLSLVLLFISSLASYISIKNLIELCLLLTKNGQFNIFLTTDFLMDKVQF